MDTAGVRRMPVQRRSIERVERLLAACAELLDEVGFDALTMSDVAERAGVPIGTLYQFFDGKNGLLRALVLRNFELLRTRLLARAAAESELDWPRAGVILVEENVAMRRTVPGFVLTGPGGYRPPAGQAEGRGDDEVTAELLYELATGPVGLPALPGAPKVVLAALSAGDAVLRTAFRLHPDGDPELIGEAIRLVRGYLAEVAGR